MELKGFSKLANKLVDQLIIINNYEKKKYFQNCFGHSQSKTSFPMCKSDLFPLSLSNNQNRVLEMIFKCYA